MVKGKGSVHEMEKRFAQKRRSCTQGKMKGDISSRREGERESRDWRAPSIPIRRGEKELNVKTGVEKKEGSPGPRKGDHPYMRREELVSPGPSGKPAL